MKKYKILIIIVALIGTLSSCGDDYLKLYPYTDVVAGAPATLDVIQQNVTGCYQILYFDCYASSQWMPVNMFFDCLGDDLYTGGEHAGDQSHLQRAALYEASSTQDAVTGWWSIFYAGLKRCNGALNAIENATSGTDEQLAVLKAEVLTLRAYYVHWLWKAYGNIPYFEDIWKEEPFLAQQYTFDEMYPKLIADLDAAINTPEFPMSVNAANRGRVNKAMAMMTKARIVLYFKDQSKYAQVLADMKTIINNGAYSLVKTATTPNFTGRLGSNAAAESPSTNNPFEWIFLRDGEFCSESIFEVNHRSDPGKSWATHGRVTVTTPLASRLHAMQRPILPSRQDGGSVQYVRRRTPYSMPTTTVKQQPFQNGAQVPVTRIQVSGLENMPPDGDIMSVPVATAIWALKTTNVFIVLPKPI